MVCGLSQGNIAHTPHPSPDPLRPNPAPLPLQRDGLSLCQRPNHVSAPILRASGYPPLSAPLNLKVAG